jgi:antitoxin MazE
MTKAIVGTWGKSLAVRIPADVARIAGLRDGEAVDIEAVDGKIVMQPDEEKAARRQRVLAAAEAIIAARKGVRLDGLSIRDLINEGRPGC